MENNQEDKLVEVKEISNSKSKSVLVAVAETIKNSGKNVEDIVVSKLVEIEVSKRVDTIITAISKLDTLKKDFNKINKPDQSIYTSPGIKGEGTYSENRNKEILDTQIKIKKLSDAIDLSLDKNDGEYYGKLSDILK